MPPRPVFPALLGYLSRPVRPREFLVWCALAIALVAFGLARPGPNLEVDSCQYLSIAGNFPAGKPGYTSIVHFDTERSHGTVPAPMTTFPSGYPAVIAALDASGLTPERSGLAISVVATLALLSLYWGVGQRLGIGGLGLRLTILLTFANAELLLFSRTIASEPLFTLLTATAVLLFSAGLAPGVRRGEQWLALLGANALAGLAYWVRYAGLFLFTAMVVYVALLILRRHQAALRATLSLAVSAGIIALGLLRNALLVGNWKGGNDKPVNHPFLGVLGRSPVEIYHLLSGRIGSAHYGLLDLVLVLACLCVAGMLAAALARTRHAAPDGTGATTVLNVVACYLVVYWAAMVYAGHVTVISFGPRMFYPLLPLLFLALAIVITRVQAQLDPRQEGRLVAALVIMACAYVAVNVRSIVAQPPASEQYRLVQAALAEEVAPGRSLGAWIAANIPAGQVIVATHGQTTGYALKRPTVSLVSREYSTQRWGEPEVRSLMQRYQATFLILYPGEDPELYDSPFLSGLLAGVRPPWLTSAARTRGGIQVLRCALNR